MDEAMRKAAVESVERAARFAVTDGKISISYIQRKLYLGYGKASIIMDELEKLGVIGPAPKNGIGVREILIKNLEDLDKIFVK